MRCPYCSTQNSQVLDTVHDTKGFVRRRRECRACQRRFSTLERPIVATPLLVKSNGERQEFERDKLFRSIRTACGKRPISVIAINHLVDRIEIHLQSLGKEEVNSRVVGDMVVEGLKEIDPIAYIRYAIVYLGLDNLEAVRTETDKLLTEQNNQRKRPSPHNGT